MLQKALKSPLYWSVLLESIGDLSEMVLPILMIAIFFSRGKAQSDHGPRAVIEKYFQAHALGNGDFIRQAFTSDAKIAFIEGDRKVEWTTENFAKRFQQQAPDEYRRIRTVERLDISGSAASAVLKLNYPNVEFTDHMSLLKIGGEWKIVSKVFYANRRDAGKDAIKETLESRMRPAEPGKIIGNIYYVGSNLISSFLITTPAGHILLDTGPVEMLPRLKNNIEKLGFKPADVKVLLNSHAHFDHCGGFAEFKRDTGATVVATKEDGGLMARGGKDDFAWGDDLAYEPIKPDRVVGDGENIELGGIHLTAHLTPGHTKGCSTWSMRVNDSGRAYDVVFLCGLTVSTYKLTNNMKYPNIVEDARKSLKKLGAMHADVMLASHGFYFDYENKVARQKAGAPNPFIDPSELQQHVGEMEKDLDEALQSQEEERSTAAKGGN
jgi:metallo-beta-lactamase class B